MKQVLTTNQRSLWLGRKDSRVNFALTFRLIGSFSVEKFRVALTRVIPRHVLFFIRLVENAQGQLICTTEGVPDVPFKIITDPGDKDWHDVVKTELGQPFDYQKGPLVRFVLIQKPERQDLIVICDHGISDGLSAIYLVRDLLSLLDGLDSPLLSLPFPPDIWALVPQAVEASQGVKLKLAVFSKWFQISHFWWKMRNRFIQQAKSVPALQQNTTTSFLCNNPPYSILYTQLTRSQTEKLLVRCRKEQTTVHAALCTAWALAMSDIQKGDKRGSIRISVPVSLRGRLPNDLRETTGFFISTAVVPVVLLPGSTFWDITRDFKQKFTAEASSESLFLGPLMAKIMFLRLAGTKEESFIQEFINRQIDYDISMTNLGNLSIPTQYGALRIGAIYGPIVNAYEKEKTVGICTIDGQMTLTLIFRESQLIQFKGKQIMDRAIALLTQNLEER